MSISGYTTLNVTPSAWQNFNRITQIKDDVSKVLNRHNLKVGFLLVHSAKNQDNQPASLNGNVNFSSFANALRGRFNTYSEAARARDGWFQFNSAEPTSKTTGRPPRGFPWISACASTTCSDLFAAQQRGHVPAPALRSRQGAQALARHGAILSAAGTYDRTNGLAVGAAPIPRTSRAVSRITTGRPTTSFSRDCVTESCQTKRRSRRVSASPTTSTRRARSCGAASALSSSASRQRHLRSDQQSSHGAGHDHQRGQHDQHRQHPYGQDGRRSGSECQPLLLR